MTSTSAALEDLIAQTIGVPTTPTVLTEITAVLESPYGSAKDAASVIEKDPANAARALRLVNSPFYGLKNSVSDTNLGCSILGIQVIKNLVVQATVLQTFQTGADPGFDANRLQDRSFKAAVACRLLAQATTLAEDLGKEGAYTCGLLQDVGKLILLASHAERFLSAVRMARTNAITLARAEARVFGVHHGHVGGLLAERWQLAEAVQHAIYHHHDEPDAAPRAPKGRIVKVATSYAHLAAEQRGGWVGDVFTRDDLAQLGIERGLHLEILRVTRLTRSS